MENTTQSTYDQHIASLSKERREKFDQGYQELLLDELLQAIMKQDEIYVRELAATADVSPTIIQGLKSGKRSNVTISTIPKVLDAVGYQLTVTPKEPKR
jgi:DNA-binding Xre family transcriptional regulator